MKFPKTKEEITQAILNELPKGTWHNLKLDKVVFTWWQTGRGGQGLRLSNVGAKVFADAKIAGWDFEIQLKSRTAKKQNVSLIVKTIAANPAFIREINKKIQCPYYIGVNKETDGKTSAPYLRLYDHKTAMMITLYGSLNGYLEAQYRKI